MTNDSIQANRAESVRALAGVGAGLMACAIAYSVLRTQTGPYDGWLLGFVIVLATAGMGAALARSSATRAFGIALAVTPLVLSCGVLVFALALGSAIGS